MSETSRQDKNEPQSEQELAVSKSEHLAEGFRPIMACVGTREEYGGEIDTIENIENVGHNVNFRAHPDLLKMHGFKNAGLETYVVSPIDEKPKFTENLFNCTSIIAVGRQKNTGKEISFLTHQNPEAFLGSQKESFVKDLEEQIKKLKEECIDGSIDIVIAGGQITQNYASEKNYAPEYKNSLDLLDLVVNGSIGFHPLVICGPKGERKDFDGEIIDFLKDDVRFDTQKRRLFITRPPQHIQDLHNRPFKVPDIEKIDKEWQKENK